jgi:large subunit ribosomal protein L20
MPRATNVPATRRRRKRTLHQARGYWGNKSRLYRFAKDAVDRSGQYAYRDRRKKKAQWRQLWIVRINAACRAQDITYSRFMNGLKVAGVELNRKTLSELAIHEPEAFESLVDRARTALN